MPDRQAGSRSVRHAYSSTTGEPEAGQRPRVVWWTNVPAPYTVERFNALVGRGTMDFKVWFSSRTDPMRSWEVDESSWAFRHQYLPRIEVAGRQLVLPTPFLRPETPDLLVSLYGSPEYLLGWSIARGRGVKTAFFVEPTFDVWVKRRRWKEALKRQLFPLVDAVFTTGPDGEAFAGRYGARSERTFYLPNFASFEHFDRRSRVAASQRERLRTELGLKGVTFLYVGRLWSGKGLDFLLDAFAVLQRQAEASVTLILVGDGVDEHALRKRCSSEGIDRVIFTGFKQRDTLPNLYAASDVFVFPTLGDPFGQVVNEAMASGLPVISTEAAGEITERIEHGVNGFIVPTRDSAAMFDRMEQLTSDPELRAAMGRAGRRKVAGQTTEAWAETFERAVRMVVSEDGLGDGQ